MLSSCTPEKHDKLQPPAPLPPRLSQLELEFLNS